MILEDVTTWALTHLNLFDLGLPPKTSRRPRRKKGMDSSDEVSGCRHPIIVLID